MDPEEEAGAEYCCGYPYCSCNLGTWMVAGCAGTAGAALLFGIMGPYAITPWAAAALVGAYWKQGLSDIAQPHHTIKRNFPVLGNMRYVLETIRPEIRQYFVESDTEVCCAAPLLCCPAESGNQLGKLQGLVPPQEAPFTAVHSPRSRHVQ